MLPSCSIAFRERVAFGLPAALGSYHKLIARHDFLAIFPEYLTNLYFTVRASVPLMEQALSIARDRQATDPICKELCRYFEHHITEERHHDEWLLEDLDALGVSPASVISRVPSHHVAAMVGAQYYWMQFSHPVCLLGYIGVVEGSPPRTETLDWLIQQRKIPKTALRTSFIHAKIDPYHKSDLDDLLDGLTLEPKQMELLCLSGISTLCHITSMYGDLLNFASST